MSKRKYVYAAVAGFLYSNVRASSVYLGYQDRTKKEREDKEKTVTELNNTKKQVESLNSILDTYRSKFPEFERSCKYFEQKTHSH